MYYIAPRNPYLALLRRAREIPQHKERIQKRENSKPKNVVLEAFFLLHRVETQREIQQLSKLLKMPENSIRLWLLRRKKSFNKFY